MHHIDLPRRSDIDYLYSYQGASAVSLYLPTSPLPQHAGASRIELKNMSREALGQIASAANSPRDVNAIRDNINVLASDDKFWAEQAHTLAIFVCPSRIRSFRLPNRILRTVEVSDRYHLKPLLRSITFPQNAFVLAIGMGAVRLIEVSADLQPETLSLPDLPDDAADALSRRSHLERAGNMQGTESGSENAILSRYARSVDRALKPILSGQERPLIIAAAEPMASIYANVCSYSHLAASVIAGSPDHASDHDLAIKSRQVLDGLYTDELDGLRLTFEERRSDGRGTSDIAQAARAATFGAVDTLIVDMDAVVPGAIDDAGMVTFMKEPDAINYGVVDEIARRAWQTGARVLAARRADIPDRGDLAAILRYAV